MMCINLNLPLIGPEDGLEGFMKKGGSEILALILGLKKVINLNFIKPFTTPPHNVALSILCSCSSFFFFFGLLLYHE